MQQPAKQSSVAGTRTGLIALSPLDLVEQPQYQLLQ
jgi:hypothetical protein